MRVYTNLKTFKVKSLSYLLMNLNLYFVKFLTEIKKNITYRFLKN